MSIFLADVGSFAKEKWLNSLGIKSYWDNDVGLF